MDEKNLERLLMLKNYTLALLDTSGAETAKALGREVRKAKLVILDNTMALSAYGAFEMFRNTMANKVAQLDNLDSRVENVQFTELYQMQGYFNTYQVIAVDRADHRAPFEFLIYETEDN